MSQNYEHAAAWVAALTGSVETVLDWRAIHDTDKGVEAWTRRGALPVVWEELCRWNGMGRGIFAMINVTDGLGREAQNVISLRAQFIDIDDGDTHAKHARAQSWTLKPHMTVRSSPTKYHDYWLVKPYNDHALYNSIQQRLITLFESDPPIWDVPRVMRVPGFLHMKNPAAPTLVTVEAGSGWGLPAYDAAQFDFLLTGVTAGGGGSRENLGDAHLAAPSLEWATRCLNAVDPNNLPRDEWIAITAAFKQAAWSHGDEVTIRFIWDQWCKGYAANDPPENDKQWRSIRNTAAGFNKLLQSSGLFAEFKFGKGPGQMPVVPLVGPGVPTVTAPVGQQLDLSSFLLTPQEQIDYFAGCTLITKDGQILTPDGRFMEPGKFNAAYGGKVFVLSADGKTTDEAWKAATRGQIFRVPQADHIRFLPAKAEGELIEDELGRKGINTYIPANVRTIAGDPSRFVQHLRLILPTEHDVLILLNYLARIVQSPGVKIPWAPVIQSVEGVGKNVIKFCMAHAVGSVYTYYPKAQQLAETGGKFNKWMRNRLFILCDEVKTDERRDLIEALKDMISEERIEIQAKGVDQELEDNFGNWLFFTNWEDAIPIDNNSRRWAIFYSGLQSEDDLIRAGMNSAYFSELYEWIRADGAAIVAHYLKHFDIDPALDPAIHQRAPKTSSTARAIIKSWTAPEAAIHDAIDSGRLGFKNGWISSAAIAMVFAELDIKCSNAALGRILDKMSYYKIGRAPQAIIQEGYKQPNLYHRRRDADVNEYKSSQGYP